MSYDIQWNSKPDYDDWGWDDYWDINDWVEWHKALKKHYGLKDANKIFIKAWEQQSDGANPIGARTFNSTFKNYAKLNNFYDQLFDSAGVFGTILKPAAATTSAVDSASNAVANVAKAAEKTTKTASYVLPIMLGVAATAAIGIGIYKYTR